MLEQLFSHKDKLHQTPPLPITTTSKSPHPLRKLSPNTIYTPSSNESLCSSTTLLYRPSFSAPRLGITPTTVLKLSEPSPAQNLDNTEQINAEKSIAIILLRLIYLPFLTSPPTRQPSTTVQYNSPAHHTLLPFPKHPLPTHPPPIRAQPA